MTITSEILETMAQKIRDGIPGVQVHVNDPGAAGIPSIMVHTERGSMSIYHMPVAHCRFPDALVAQIESTPGIDMSALGEVYDGGAPFMPGESLLIDLKSPGGEMPGMSLVGWFRDMARDGRRRARANRYERISIRYREPFRFRVRASRGGKGK